MVFSRRWSVQIQKTFALVLSCLLLAACSEKTVDAPEQPLALALFQHVAQGEQEAAHQMILSVDDADKIYQEIARALRGSLESMPTVQSILVKSRRELGDGGTSLRIQVQTEPSRENPLWMTVVFQKDASGTDRIRSVKIVTEKED